MNFNKVKETTNDSDGLIAEKVDLLFEKRKAVREAALNSLHTTLSLRYCGESLELRQETLADGLERVMKDLQLEPTLLALKTTSLASISVQSGHQALFSKFNDILQRLITNKALDVNIRIEAINTLSLLCFMGSIFDKDHDGSITADIMIFLSKNIFSVGSEIPHDIIRAALNGCILLGSTMPNTTVHDLLFKNYFSQLVPLLDEKYDIMLRITAAKAITALVESERNRLKEEGSPEELEEDLNPILDSMTAVLDDKAKFKNKVELKKQRSTLKSLIAFVEGGEVEEETVFVRSTRVILRSWDQIFRMDRFRGCLGEGFMNHLEENRNIMQIFDYFVDTSAPVVQTMTKQQRRQSLEESSKIATKARFTLRAIREQEVGYSTE